MWRYGGGDWTLPWRVFHGLDERFRPVSDPDGDPIPIVHVARYRRLLYGYAKAAAVLEEGHPAQERKAVRQRSRTGPSAGPPEQRTEGGVVLPTGTPAPPR